MEIFAKLLKFKFLFLFAVAFALIFSLIYVVPSFRDVLAYFWPLLVSTALFLVTVGVFAQTSPPATDAPGEKAAEGLLEFVAGQPEVVHEPTDEESSKSELM